MMKFICIVFFAVIVCAYGEQRVKREIPTQAEINLAQRVKFCMEQNKETDSTNCMAKILGSNAQNVDHVKLQTIINYEAVLAELKEYFKAKEEGKTLKEFLESKKRPKRDTPTQAEIQLAQRVKFCMDQNKETDSTNCMAKILGSNAQNVDHVKLQTIINYEAVLAELKEYFKAKEEGKTLKEFLESKKRPKRDIPTQAEIQLAQRVKFCMEQNKEIDSTNCMAKILGSNAQNVDHVKIQTIINYEAVLAELKEYFKAKEQGKTLKEFLESKKHG
jgi:predicted transcriptional regulator with HTH domain